jgi:hypothetical protein
LAAVLIHALISVLVQVAVGLLSGDWVIGGVVLAAFYVGRELTQAEYRWIEQYGWGLRSNMPWWGAFDRRVWGVKSVLDFVLPALAVAVVAILRS